MAQGIPNRSTPLMSVPHAPKRPDLAIEPVGYAPFDKVASAVTLARVWFRSLNVSFGASDLTACADLMLAVEREWAASGENSPPAPVKPSSPKPASAARKRVHPQTSPAKKGEPTP